MYNHPVRKTDKKHILDRIMLTIFFSHYERTDGLTNKPSKIIIKDILTLFTVISKTHITNVLLKEVLTNPPLLIIKKKITDCNFLNKDGINLLIDKDNHKSLIDSLQTIIVVNERLYGESLFHIFL